MSILSILLTMNNFDEIRTFNVIKCISINVINQNYNDRSIIIKIYALIFLRWKENNADKHLRIVHIRTNWPSSCSPLLSCPIVSKILKIQNGTQKSNHFKAHRTCTNAKSFHHIIILIVCSLNCDLVIWKLDKIRCFLNTLLTWKCISL